MDNDLLGEQSPTFTMTKLKTKTEIQPLGDRVLAKQVDAPNMTAGGIYIPDVAKEKPKEGIVISVGNGRLLEDGSRTTFSVEAGDRILFTTYAATEVKYDGESFLIIREEDILGKICSQ